VNNVTKVSGIFVNETDCKPADHFDDIKNLFDIPREKRITCKLRTKNSDENF
jgi:hypothetical protein